MCRNFEEKMVAVLVVLIGIMMLINSCALRKEAQHAAEQTEITVESVEMESEQE